MFTAESTDGLCKLAGEVEGCEANAVPIVSRMPRAEAAGIIAQDRVEHTAATVLNVPAATQVIQQKGRVGCGTRQAGDRVGRAAASLALLGGLSFQAEELLGIGPDESVMPKRSVQIDAFLAGDNRGGYRPQPRRSMKI